MYLPQVFGNTHKALHRIIGVADYAGTEKQPFYIIATIKFHRQFHQFGYGEGGARKVIATSVDAVGAIVDTIIGKHDFQQRYAPPVLGKTMAYPPSPHSITQQPRFIGTHCATGRTGNIVLCGFRKYLQFSQDIFVHKFPIRLFPQIYD